MTRDMGRLVMRYTRRIVLLACSAAALSSLVLPSGSAGASTEQPRLVSTNPANVTPNVEDGRVLAVAQVGTTIVLGGTFSSVTAGGTTYARSRLVAFDATTGSVLAGFHPTTDGEVAALAPAADGRSVYVAGAFNTVNGATHRKVVRLNIANGSVAAGFAPGAVNGKVNDLKVAGSNVYLGGKFTTVAGQSRSRMASLDAATGALTGKLNVAFAGVNHGGGTFVSKFDVTPDGSRIVAIGNFASVDGQTRRQIVMLDSSGASAVVTGWATDRFPDVCASVFNTYLRDLDFSPGGDYFVVSTTGAYRGPDTLCDSITRWETGRTGAGQQPTWVDHTGGDTTYAVAATGVAVYAGGHMRWLNNSYAGDRPGPGAVPHEGIVALDPRTGLPFSWPAFRARGVGVFDMLATDQGLWLGSDTNFFGGERRQRIAFLPLAGGTSVPTPQTPQLPATSLRLSSPGGSVDTVYATPLDSNGSPGPTSRTPGTETFRNARGAFVVGSTLYSPWSDGTLRARSVSGTTLGAATTVNLYGGGFGGEAPAVTGITYDAGTSRIYYTLAGDSRLFWRWFLPENGLVGTMRFESPAGALPAADVRGMFVSGSWLYYASATDGDLRRIAFDAGTTGSFGPGVTGTPQLVDTSRDWRSRGLTLS